MKSKERKEMWGDAIDLAESIGTQGDRPWDIDWAVVAKEAAQLAEIAKTLAKEGD